MPRRQNALSGSITRNFSYRLQCSPALSLFGQLVHPVAGLRITARTDPALAMLSLVINASSLIRSCTGRYGVPAVGER
ncbi:hypothetical protein OOK13_29890 [Streptomyces sp. NBC_00378]|uniref:hypothetical protein n=1 Tax=unclassified Streptomyces TaxID=2593676 RepID=UPI00224D8A86|nr:MULTISPECIES: hypothetical protein [unclassified Streptomyces]MCX5112604.1 hypothetical protein [Streptomyces sp. NBC_00378]